MKKSTKHLPRESLGDSYNSVVKKKMVLEQFCFQSRIRTLGHLLGTSDYTISTNGHIS